jgi:hypothetical protein
MGVRVDALVHNINHLSAIKGTIPLTALLLQLDSPLSPTPTIVPPQHLHLRHFSILIVTYLA